jgi:peptidylprolyl isomerase|uniref:peptidylprolyl isomerase n=1 Tax=Eutreptiella gymnastica TaxID=73025 RepID=A0A7S4FUE6_9EUGL|mmetsp:Transcript_73399/g.123646  ORF Transcript_73399/g.123646 Transcript_73399/m.123646 type:complete len:409 (+) Transcript_73399:71-1297(+)|eukprot:CAMPEP_0174295366 /NCGR_PEP_ID=MMETSP0809-20121228/44498_1 /TAXON_ID=73025 ORGANISM="Eutreptiella gymnastica-like, Strain CCMP1594" /NCGR_SAMPLE_ID=MMETSP0809 /ASSEMBLY_ACC=CAM_ASM_000658 /LENGTH=408 /DNA_ID=CAMNT_0015397587 /DNA_START=70 /DNA_END=1296 /DNA_ORIENTATION=-
MDATALVQKVRRIVLGRGGNNGYRQLRLSFKVMDSSGDLQLSKAEFAAGLRKFGLPLSAQEEDQLMAAFDTQGDGLVSLKEFFQTIRGPMNSRRTAIVDQAFAALDKDGSGVCDLNDLRGTYDASRHPQVIAGRATEKDILDQFLRTFDSQTNPDGTVTYDEFHEYYNGLSGMIDNDDYFESMVIAAWNLGRPAASIPQGTTVSAPQLRRTVERRTETGPKRMTDTGRVFLQEYGATRNPLVYLDISISGAEPNRVLIELFADIAPKTSENFRALCTGENGMGLQGQPLHYKGLKFHRMIPGFMLQSGDVVFNNGKGGESIYGRHFDDETFEASFKNAGMVAMANTGPNTNNSQFFITTKEARYLDDRHVAFGKVVHNFDFLLVMEKYGSDNGTPLKEVVIEDCGQLQ